MIRSLAQIKLGKHSIHIIPWTALKYFLVSTLLLLALFLAIEYWIIPSQVQQGHLQILTNTERKFWEEEAARISVNLERRVTDDPEMRLWRSAGHIVDRGPADHPRVLVMGDSFIYGIGLININDSWWRLLERELHHRGYRDVEVLASGFPGASTRMEFELAKAAVPQLRPDIVIWGYVSNDPDERAVPKFKYAEHDVAAVQKALGPDPVLAPLLSAGKTIFPMIVNQLENLREKKRLAIGTTRRTGFAYSVWERKLLEGENFHFFRRTLQRISHLMDRFQLPYFFMTLPPQPHVERYRPLFDGVRPAFEKEGIPFYDILDDLAREVPNPNDPLTWALPIDQHPGPRSAHFFAVKAADYLETHYADLLGKKQNSGVKTPLRINDWLPANMSVQPKNGNVFSIEYPDDDSLMLTYPLGEYHVQLCLYEPVELSNITLKGENLVSARVVLTTVRPEVGFDDRSLYELSSQAGDGLTWNISPENVPGAVNTIRIVVEFSSESVNRNLTLELGRRDQ